MTRTYDVAVIGAGPAGALAAREAARLGASVLLVDKTAFPRDKVCGCCVNRAALATLDAVGLGSLCDGHGARPLRRLALTASGREVAIPLPGGVSLSRRRLDMALVGEAVRCGVTFRDRCSASLVAREAGHGFEQRFGSGPSLKLRTGSDEHVEDVGAVVVADGLAGRFLQGAGSFDVTAAPGSRMGCGTTMAGSAWVAPGTVHMFCGEGGYVGFVRLEDGRVDVAAAMDVAYVRKAGGPGCAAAAIVGDDAACLIHAAWHGTPALTRRRRCVAADGVFIAGDAAGYIEPFTGEGIAWALTSGAAVAEFAVAAARGEASPKQLARAWSRRHGALVRRRQLSCRLVAAALRRPTVMRAALTLLGRWPQLARPVTGCIASPLAGAPA